MAIRKSPPSERHSTASDRGWPRGTVSRGTLRRNALITGTGAAAAPERVHEGGRPKPLLIQEAGDEFDLALLGAPGGVPQRFQHVLAIEVGILRWEFIDGSSGTDLADDHPDGHALSADARLGPMTDGSCVMRGKSLMFPISSASTLARAQHSLPVTRKSKARSRIAPRRRSQSGRRPTSGRAICALPPEAPRAEAWNVLPPRGSGV